MRLANVFLISVSMLTFGCNRFDAELRETGSKCGSYKEYELINKSKISKIRVTLKVTDEQTKRGGQNKTIVLKPESNRILCGYGKIYEIESEEVLSVTKKH